MNIDRSWSAYSPTYRAAEMRCLAKWIAEGTSGAVVGMGGAGKSNLLGYLCHRPDALAQYLPADAGPVAVVLVDLNDLPALQLATFYRVLLRALVEARDRFPDDLQRLIAESFAAHRAVTDPFVVQTALRDVLLACRAEGLRVVIVLDRFDKFCLAAPPALMDTLRGLRDSFKGTLTYIAGMRQTIAYLADPAVLGELYEVLDTHVCHVGAMEPADAHRLVAEGWAQADDAPAPVDVEDIVALTGGYPALIKAVAQWWIGHAAATPTDGRLPALIARPSVRFRLGEIWGGLTQSEQAALRELRRLETRAAAVADRPAVTAPQLDRLVADARARLARDHGNALASVAERGLLRQGEGTDWRVRSDLLAAYIDGAEAGSGARGRLWRDDESGELWLGPMALDTLTHLERRALTYLLAHPRTRLSKSTVIAHVWAEEAVSGGVSDDALYQVIKELRRKIEPDPAQPCYVITWRGQPEGGYQVFPEGRPSA